MLRLSDFDAITFDVYGTLIDWEPYIIRFLSEWAETNDLDANGEDLLMAFDRARAEVQKERPAHLYPEVLRRCFDRINVEYDVPVDVGVREAFAGTPHAWPAYADGRDSLRALQSQAKVGALSNIDDASLKSSCEKLDFIFDLVVTAERVGAYKPDWPHFRTAITELGAKGVSQDRILHVGQSLRADIKPANKLGIKCAWINRPNRLLGLVGDGAADAKPDLTVSSLEELVQAITQVESA